MRPFALIALAACGSASDPVVIEIDTTSETTRSFEVDGARDVHVTSTGSFVLEAWVDNGTIADRPVEQLAAGASEQWFAPYVVDGGATLTIVGDGDVTLHVFGRGEPAPPATRERSLAWVDGALLDDPSTISFARVMAAISLDGHGGALLDRWFRAFAAGPGAGRASFAQFVDELVTTQGPDPAAWDLDTLPMKVTGIHNRHDLGRGRDCGELRISIASSHPTFSPVHFIFLFANPIHADDVTPDGAIHCRGSARRWARLATLDGTAFHTAARELIAETFTRESFLLAESVELSISPWQWRQWQPDGRDGLANPPLFQTVDVDRLNAAGELRDDFLAELRANAEAVAERTWAVPARFRSAVAEVQPNVKAALVELPADLDPTLARTIGMIGCPRCHTDNADFLQTGFDRKPSPFYDRELDARARRLDALNRGEWVGNVPFGPLQSF